MNCGTMNILKVKKSLKLADRVAQRDDIGSDCRRKTKM